MCHILARNLHPICPSWSFYTANDAPIMIRRDKNMNFKCLPTVSTVVLNLYLWCLRDQAILIKLKCPSEKGHAFTASKIFVYTFKCNSMMSFCSHAAPLIVWCAVINKKQWKCIKKAKCQCQNHTLWHSAGAQRSKIRVGGALCAKSSRKQEPRLARSRLALI